MKIRYEVAIDDLLAFNRFHFANSPTIRRGLRNLQWTYAAITLGCFVATSYFLDDVAFSIAGIAGAVAAFSLTRSSVKRQLDRNVRKLHSEGDNKGTLGWHELELIEGHLIERTAYNESRWTYAGIERIVADDAHTFIYVSALNAHAIPHVRITEGSLEAFVAALEDRVERTKSGNAKPWA